MTKKGLFLELARPNNDGVSRWVSVDEFVGKYKELKLGNGGSWLRTSSALAKEFIVETDKSITSGNSIDAIRLNGFNTNKQFNHAIRQDIKDYYKDKKCVILGIKGFSENTKIEIDHKDGRKNDERISKLESQKIEDFQPLCKAANDVKRQICKECKKTNIRWDAKNIKGNPYSYYEGNEKYTEELGCKGCYQYDPVEYRKESVRKITKEVAETISKKLLDEK